MTLTLVLTAFALLAPQETAGMPLQPASELVAEVHGLRFHSAFLLNVHHTLYAAAWARRPEAGTLRALAGPLPAPLDAEMTPEERSAWTAAVDYYDREVASRDLLFARGMVEIKTALAAGDLSAPAITPEHRRVLESAAPVYRRCFWTAHDRVNRQWIESTVTNIRKVGPDVIGTLEKLYGVPWSSSPIRVDVVWVGNRQGAYTTIEPTHVTTSAGDPDNKDWSAVETVFHEVSHALVLPLQGDLQRALGDHAREHRVLWHVVQFYLTGSAVRQALRARGIEYVPYLYSTGLFDRAWPQYRKAVETAWQPYVEGTTTRDAAIAATLRLLGAGVR